MHQLTFCSVNLRNAHANDGADAWPQRQEFLAQTLQLLDADVIGVQECMDIQHQWLGTTFPEHTITSGLPYGNHAPHEYVAIAWRTSLFHQQSAGAFHLSLTPRVPSRSWDTSWMRVANYVVLRHRLTGQDICVCNTHLDHIGAQSRLASIDVITQQLAHLAHLPTIVMGDFNTPPDSPVHAKACAAGFVDSWQAAGHRDGTGVMTFHGFRGAAWPSISGERDDARIDWILLRDPGRRLAGTSAHIITLQSPAGRFPSDHYPVVAKYRLTS